MLVGTMLEVSRGKLSNNGFIDFAITYIEQYRNKIDDFYSLELGNYYTSKMLFENSLEEYLLHLKYNPQNYKIVSNRIMMFPNISEIQKKCIKILNDSSIQNSKLILSDIEFRAENFEESYYLLKNNYNNPNDLIEFAQEISKLNLYDKAIEIIKFEGKASTSFLQRKLQIGYNRAARIIDMMEAEGIVSKANHVGKREVL